MIKEAVHNQCACESPPSAFSIAISVNNRRSKHYFGFWLLGVLTLIACGLGDAAMVAVAAGAISASQLFAVGFSFLLTAGGLLFTLWRFEA
jgi:hypothetical protein